MDIMGAMQMGLPAELESISDFVPKNAQLSPLLRLVDAKTYVESLTWATEEIGYASKPQEEAQRPIQELGMRDGCCS